MSTIGYMVERVAMGEPYKAALAGMDLPVEQQREAIESAARRMQHDDRRQFLDMVELVKELKAEGRI